MLLLLISPVFIRLDYTLLSSSMSDNASYLRAFVNEIPLLHGMFCLDASLQALYWFIPEGPHEYSFSLINSVISLS